MGNQISSPIPAPNPYSFSPSVVKQHNFYGFCDRKPEEVRSDLNASLFKRQRIYFAGLAEGEVPKLLRREMIACRMQPAKKPSDSSRLFSAKTQYNW